MKVIENAFEDKKMNCQRLAAFLLFGAITGASCSGDSALKSNAAKAEVEKFVLGHLAAFEAGDLDRWGTSMMDDVFMIAADPAEAIASRAAILAERHKDFDPAFEAGLKLSIRRSDSSSDAISSRRQRRRDGSGIDGGDGDSFFERHREKNHSRRRPFRALGETRRSEWINFIVLEKVAALSQKSPICPSTYFNPSPTRLRKRLFGPSPQTLKLLKANFTPANISCPTATRNRFPPYFAVVISSEELAKPHLRFTYLCGQYDDIINPFI
jgi:hypothetical protein